MSVVALADERSVRAGSGGGQPAAAGASDVFVSYLVRARKMALKAMADT